MITTPFIEQNCTVQFQGQSFTSGGAIATDDYLIAYPAKDGALHDWHGNKIGTYRITSSRPAIFFGRCRSWQGSTYYYMRATVAGKQYALQGFGIGMVAKGKRCKAN